MGACKALARPRSAFPCQPAVDFGGCKCAAAPNAFQMPNVPQMETTMSRIMLLPWAMLAAITIQSSPALATEAQEYFGEMEPNVIGKI